MREPTKHEQMKDLMLFRCMDLPSYFNYVSCDKDGTLWGWENLPPVINIEHGGWVNADNETFSAVSPLYITLDIKNLDWKKLMVRLDN